VRDPPFLTFGGVSIERDTDEPVYVQLAAILRSAIDSGDIPPRRPIPSKNTLMQEHGIALGTVNHALSLLRADGYIRTSRGRGLFVVPLAERAAVAAEYQAGQRG
jgi:GntR family transcriptional regulator